MTVTEEILINAVPILILRALNAIRQVRIVGDRDETKTILNRLRPILAEQMLRRKVIILRREQSLGITFAVTPLAVFRPTIIVDYNVAQTEPETEEFILAHELAHIKQRDALVHYVCINFLLAAITSLAFALASWVGGGKGVVVGICAIVLGYIILLVPAASVLRFGQEIRADRFAADLLGHALAIRSLHRVRDVYVRCYPESWMKIYGLRDLTKREQRLRSL